MHIGVFNEFKKTHETLGKKFNSFVPCIHKYSHSLNTCIYHLLHYTLLHTKHNL